MVKKFANTVIKYDQNVPIDGVRVEGSVVDVLDLPVPVMEFVCSGTAEANEWIMLTRLAPQMRIR